MVFNDIRTGKDADGDMLTGRSYAICHKRMKRGRVQNVEDAGSCNFLLNSDEAYVSSG